SELTDGTVRERERAAVARVGEADVLEGVEVRGLGDRGERGGEGRLDACGVKRRQGRRVGGGHPDLPGTNGRPGAKSRPGHPDSLVTADGRSCGRPRARDAQSAAIPHVTVCDAPGSRTTRSVPSLNAPGGHVIGSTARPARKSSGARSRPAGVWT